MSAEWLAYPFLFIAIFFESFVLVTFLSLPARKARARSVSLKTPSISIVVPCYNEALTIRETTESLLALDYPKELLSIILVNDGSRDGTREVMEQFRTNPQVSIIHKENGGKHTALNAGIAASDAELIGCLDADSFVEKSALREIIPCFENTKVAAATAAMVIHEPSNFLQHMQNGEYIFGIMIRHTLSVVNGLYVTPGPFSFYRRHVVIALGGFEHGHQTEDLEMALRLQKAGYEIENAPRARVYTKAPKTMRGLIKQRTRWTSGFLRNALQEYRGLIGNVRYGALGSLVLPLAIFSVGGGILVFGLGIYLFIAQTYEAFVLRAGVPLAYSYLPQGPFVFDWFYLPSTLLLLLGIITLGAALAFIYMGKKISKTPGPLMHDLIAYLAVFNFVAPLWLFASVVDVARGKKRSWR